MCRKLIYLFSLVLVSSLVLPSVVSAISTSHVGWWKLDDGSGITAADSTSYGNHGTLFNGPVWVSGYDGGALQFDGVDDYVDCGNDASLSIGGSVTVAGWIKLNQTGLDHKIAGNQNNSTGGYKMGVFTNNLVEFEIRTASNSAILNRGVRLTILCRTS